MLICFQGDSLAQSIRILHKIDDGQRITMPGYLHPLAGPRFDHGRVDASLNIDHITLVLEPSQERAAELDRLLAELHDPKSGNYHRWLTPESYAERFGASPGDIAAIAEWLTEQDLTVTSVARPRNAITFTGSLDAIETTLETEIHRFVVGGETYYANTTEPSIPTALSGMVLAIHGLNNFPLQPRHRLLQTPITVQTRLRPRYTSPDDGKHYLVPDDIATIFNVSPLYGSGFDGTGQSIVIVGQSKIDLSHLRTFRSTFGLPDSEVTTILVPNTRDPGVRQQDAQESDLDLQWASAVARGASLKFVYSYDVSDAVQYAIDQNLAPVLSMSYGGCESHSTSSDALTLQTWAKQANAQGITWVAASGDSGAADCYPRGPAPVGLVDVELAVDLPASIPEVTGIGGTRFDEGSGTYWSTTNASGTYASAQSYIPETSWNDSSKNSPAASGGGKSQYFGKPSWQTGDGVSSDDSRCVPDVALPASAAHDGYAVYTTSGHETGWYAIGGTSAGAPAFSGMLAILNQYLLVNGYQQNAGLGNVNTRLYELAKSSPWVFHDVTSGDNTITGTVCSGFLCSSSTTKSVGYTAAAGYDLVTGLGSLDTLNFFTAWQN